MLTCHYHHYLASNALRTVTMRNGASYCILRIFIAQDLYFVLRFRHLVVRLGGIERSKFRGYIEIVLHWVAINTRKL